MPGSSLWLVPPPDSDLHKALQDLITTHLPSIYPSSSSSSSPPPPNFPPHITLTSSTTTPPTDPQAWLDSIPLSPEEVLAALTVSIRDPLVGTPFFRKLTLACGKTRELCDLAVRCRVAGVEGVEEAEARKWMIASFGPHCSLMYSDLSVEEVEGKLHEVGERVRSAREQYPGSGTARGGSVWLVPTSKGIEDWKPVATRQLHDIKWEWLT
ncbi:hypothetical protein B0A55_02213 [Friedmanniomyces simplex]|uniref:2',3'-cyclic-nucleotide 3'-phosphodiesterase n=1 Tax=Friedmanniomyces simplex TaxID=329884 RepID=A0A4U0XUE7_9PEZI|nr:hypothetical protein B0A55_02213 [Friedmanniomyces simplex]